MEATKDSSYLSCTSTRPWSVSQATRIHFLGVTVRRPFGRIRHVFDVDPGATSFCAREFGVRPLYFKNPNRWTYAKVPFGLYDVIWLGSVLTHLSKEYTREVLTLMFRILKPDGLLIFTTHGEKTFPRLQAGYYGSRFMELAPGIMNEFMKAGFSFVPYEQAEVEILPFHFVRASDFGMTWMGQP